MAAGRIGPVAHAAEGLTAELRATMPALGPALARFDPSKLDGPSRQLLERGAAALERFNTELGRTNDALRSLASRPLFGAVMGQGEAELKRLGAAIDGLRAWAAEVAKYVSR